MRSKLTLTVAVLLAGALLRCAGDVQGEVTSTPRCQSLRRPPAKDLTEARGETKAEEQDVRASRQELEVKVREVLARPAFRVEDKPWEWIASLGEEAVPLLIQALESGDAYSPFSIVRAFGLIGDRRATPVLLDMLRKEKAQAHREEIIKALARIGDPRAQPVILSTYLSVFKDKKEDGMARLQAARAIAEIGDPRSKRQVRRFVSRLQELQRRTGFLMDEEAEKELETMGMSVEDVPDVADVAIELADRELILEILTWQMVGPKRVAKACEALAESRDKEGIDALFGLAENDKKFWPEMPSGLEIVTRLEGKPYEELNDYEKGEIELIDKEYAAMRRVPVETRIAAARALVTVKDEVDTERLVKALVLMMPEIPDRREELEALLAEVAGDG